MSSTPTEVAAPVLPARPAGSDVEALVPRTDVSPSHDRSTTRPELTVLVLTGTSEHPFDRLIGWVDSWYTRQIADGRDIAVTIQSGTSTLSTSATSIPMLTVEELRAHAVDADVIVCHGGPGTIHDALSAGVRPIVAPRSGAAGEHVDDHQQRFADFLERTASIDSARDGERLHQLLDEALADPAAYTADTGALVSASADTDDIGRRIARLVDTGRRPGRRRLTRRFQRPGASSAELDVLLVCSSGGHLRQLWRLMPWLEDNQRSWVTFDTADATSLLAAEDTITAHSPTTRNIPNLLRNARLAWRLLRMNPPDVIISSGAGVAVPFFWFSRLIGIPTVYVEVFDRVDSATLTGRLCRPATDLFLVQWEEQTNLYRSCIPVGHLL